MKKANKARKKTSAATPRKRPPHLLPSYSAVGPFSGNLLTFQKETRHKLWQLGNSAREGDSRALQAIQSIAGDALDQLLRLATGGNVEAIGRFVGSLSTTIGILEEAQAMRQQKFTAYAQTQEEWPALLGIGRTREKEHAALKTKLELGHATGLDPFSKALTQRAPGTLAAMCLKKFIEHYRKFPGAVTSATLPDALADRSQKIYSQQLLKASQLPPLSKATAKQWWTTGRPFLPVLFGEEFQDDELFSRLLSKERRELSRGRLRSEIRRRIEQGLNSIATSD